MSQDTRIHLALKAQRELGLRQVGFYALYWLGLRTGYYKRVMKAGGRKELSNPSILQMNPVLELPEKVDLITLLGDDGVKSLMDEANEILAGKVRLFGGPPVSLRLSTQVPLSHWTHYVLNNAYEGSGDIKFIWETGRFGWACTLARAYYLSGEEVYAEKFWALTDTFLEANPPNMGPHWVSAQEVALRIMALTFSYQVFMGSPSSTSGRVTRLAVALVEHAKRIPPTLVYARAQNNNHLLSEAVGLYTAGLLLNDHPMSARWRETGWDWFTQAIETQIAVDGTYIQHSTSYHRLMLQVAMWMEALARNQGEGLPAASTQRLSKATMWLVGLYDPASGCVPNLGPNDGANILPLTVCSITDYRPVIQAAHCAFFGEPLFESGLWDELNIWLQDRKSSPEFVTSKDALDNKTKYILRSSNSWAYLRAARFNSRPGHADQLHLDLWWRGLNIAQDPGTFSYNAPAPWDNPLTRTTVHNTITVNGRDQMTYAGRFLWLDWAQGKLIYEERSSDGSWEQVIAQHDGYRKLNIVHQRKVLARIGDRWIIEDRILRDVQRKLVTPNTPVDIEGDSTDQMLYSLRLHWLLPDWQWSLVDEDDRVVLTLASPYGPVGLSVAQKEISFPQQPVRTLLTQIVRAGESLYGSADSVPVRGWTSPTYGYKKPALSVTFDVETSLPYTYISEWQFPI